MVVGHLSVLSVVIYIFRMVRRPPFCALMQNKYGLHPEKETSVVNFRLGKWSYFSAAKEISNRDFMEAW